MSFGTAVYCFFQLVTRLKHGSGYRVIYIKIKRLYREKTAYIKTHETARGPHRRDVTHILSKVSGFLLKSFHFRRLQRRQVFFPHTNPYISNITQQGCSYFELGLPVMILARSKTDKAAVFETICYASFTLLRLNIVYGAILKSTSCNGFKRRFSYFLATFRVTIGSVTQQTLRATVYS